MGSCCNVQTKGPQPQQAVQNTNIIRFEKIGKIIFQNPYDISEDLVRKSNKEIKKIFSFGEKLGNGAFGDVIKVRHRITQQLFACKIIEKKDINENKKNNLIREVEVLRKLDHPNIIKVYGFYDNQDFYFIITEYCSGGRLFDKISFSNPTEEKEAAIYMKQIFYALIYLHSNRIAHRDLKPENIMLKNKNSKILKIIDFGLSREYAQGEFMNNKKGTPTYIAPEVLRMKYTEKCDI